MLITLKKSIMQLNGSVLKLVTTEMDKVQFQPKCPKLSLKPAQEINVHILPTCTLW